MLQTQDLEFIYKSKLYFRFPNIHLKPKESLLVLGESGVGKTTLLHLLAGLLKPKAGQIKIDETAINELSTAKLDHFRGQHVGLIFQRPHFIQSLNLIENLLMVQYVAKKSQSRQLALQLLEQLGIGDKALTSINQLSQGEKQRGSIAIATINQPKVILADEPTASLDDKNCMKVLNLLKEQAQKNKANLLVITHDERIKNGFDQVLVLEKDKIQG